MKSGRPLDVLAAEIVRQSNAKKDFVAPTSALAMIVNNAGKTDEEAHLVIGEQNFAISGHCHSQIGAWSKIPAAYYNRMLADALELLATNVMHWFDVSEDKRMIRTLDGRARAFMSNRYRPLDNDELANAILPVLAEAGVNIESCELTESHFYLKAVAANVTAQVRGETAHAGVVISNSEVGAGSLRVEPLVYMKKAGYGMIASNAVMKKYHVGRANTCDENALWEMFTDETRKATDKALWKQVKDVVNGALSESIFARLAEQFDEAGRDLITVGVADAIEVVTRKFNLSEGTGEGILQKLAAGGDLSVFGLSKAISAQSDAEDDYDLATTMQRIAGEVVELGSKRLGISHVA